jgi:hypothetical protein
MALTCNSTGINNSILQLLHPSPIRSFDLFEDSCTLHCVYSACVRVQYTRSCTVRMLLTCTKGTVLLTSMLHNGGGIINCNWIEPLLLLA